MANNFQQVNYRTGLAAEFTASNPILGTNEVGVELDTGISKRGDGSTAWTSLKNSHFSQIFKTADQTKNTDAVLADDAALLFPVLANTKYAFRMRVFFDTTAAADFKYAIAGPAAPTLARIVHKAIDPTALTTLGTTSAVAAVGSTALAAGAGTTGGYIEIEGIWHNGANAGNVSFQWAQNTSNGSDTIVRAGSYVEVKQLS